MWRIGSCTKSGMCLPGWAICTIGLGRDWLSLKDQDVRGIGRRVGEFARVRLAFADAHFKCISVQVSTAGGIALNAPRHEKGFGGERGGAEGQGI